MTSLKVLSFHLRENYPDFLDLPWNFPLSQWHVKCPYMINIEKGLSRHIVIFIQYEGIVFAIKELPQNLAEKEFIMLKKIVASNLSCVEPVGHIKLLHLEDNENISILITEYLESSLPYRFLFMKPKLYRYREKMLNAIAVLLVRIHLAGFYWGVL